MPYLLAMFEENGLVVDHFSYVDDVGALHEEIDLRLANQAEQTFHLNYGCGLFRLHRPA
jgi:hypothetical protein